MEWKREVSERRDKTLGYFYFMDREHPLGDKKGRVWFHRHIMSMEIGRWLEPHEEVHHLDGDPANNDPTNLVIKTKREHIHLHALERGYTLCEKRKCPVCGNEFVNQAKVITCSIVCSGKSRRKFDPSREELEKAIYREPMTKIAKRYGVSDRAIKKRCDLLGIVKCPWPSGKAPVF